MSNLVRNPEDCFSHNEACIIFSTGGVLFAVNGPDYSNADITVQGFTIEIDTGKLRAVWNIPNKVFFSKLPIHVSFLV